MRELELFILAYVLIWLRTVRISASVQYSRYSRQRFGMDPSIADYMISNTSVRSSITCSYLCRQKACQSFVYMDSGYCTLYEVFLRSLDNYVDGLYAIQNENSGSVCHDRYFNNHNLTNVAFGKTVTMSSVYSWQGDIGYPSIAVDGVRNSWPCASTFHSFNPYMIVDLGQTYSIIGFYILKRDDCCPTRLRNLKISVGATLSALNEVVDYADIVSTECTFILPNPVNGQFVKLLINDSSNLTVCELEVYAIN